MQNYENNLIYKKKNLNKQVGFGRFGKSKDYCWGQYDMEGGASFLDTRIAAGTNKLPTACHPYSFACLPVKTMLKERRHSGGTAKADRRDKGLFAQAWTIKPMKARYPNTQN